MTELLTAAQMRAIEQAAIASGEVTGLELMERAGQGVVDAIFEEWPDLRRVGETHRALVLCGPGNNGGDGFVIARLLKETGWDVDVFLYGDPEKLPPDAKTNWKRWLELGDCSDLVDSEFDTSDTPGPDAVLAIDAMFGSGLSRPLRDLPNVQDTLNYYSAGFSTRHWTGRQTPRVVSVDVPSGLSADTGRYLGYSDYKENPFDCCAMANLTVTFHRPFRGHVLQDGPAACGKLAVKSIGLERDGETGRKDEFMSRLIHMPERSPAHFDFNLSKSSLAHKYSHGHALVLSGGVGKGGAARLAARGALRIGAGAVTLGAPPAALIENAAQLNAIMLVPVKDADHLTEALQDKRINALCLGPGMGLGKREQALLEAALQITRPGLDPGPQPKGSEASPGRDLVLDADALTLLSRDPALMDALHARCILTPHAGEFARLFPDIAAQLSKDTSYSKVDATRDAAKRAGCIVLFKGPDTVISDPSGHCSVNASVYERSAPWLATAGSGDVLAGFITGLLARGFDPIRAAETGAWLHTECALSFGPGLIAEDLPEELPKVLKKLL